MCGMQLCASAVQPHTTVEHGIGNQHPPSRHHRRQVICSTQHHRLCSGSSRLTAHPGVDVATHNAGPPLMLQVIQRANATEYGLAAAVWTQSLDRMQAVTRGVKAGTVWGEPTVLHPPLGAGPAVDTSGSCEGTLPAGALPPQRLRRPLCKVGCPRQRPNLLSLVLHQHRAARRHAHAHLAPTLCLTPDLCPCPLTPALHSEHAPRDGCLPAVWRLQAERVWA